MEYTLLIPVFGGSSTIEFWKKFTAQSIPRAGDRIYLGKKMKPVKVQEVFHRASKYGQVQTFVKTKVFYKNGLYEPKIEESALTEFGFIKGVDKSKKSLPQAGVKRHCSGCKWSGMDMDMEPYCAHPKTIEKMPHGSILSSPSDARDHCGESYDSWEPRGG